MNGCARCFVCGGAAAWHSTVPTTAAGTRAGKAWQSNAVAHRGRPPTLAILGPHTLADLCFRQGRGSGGSCSSRLIAKKAVSGRGKGKGGGRSETSGLVRDWRLEAGRAIVHGLAPARGPATCVHAQAWPGRLWSRNSSCVLCFCSHATSTECSELRGRTCSAASAPAATTPAPTSAPAATASTATPAAGGAGVRCRGLDCWWGARPSQRTHFLAQAHTRGQASGALPECPKPPRCARHAHLSRFHPATQRLPRPTANPDSWEGTAKGRMRSSRGTRGR